MINNQAGFNSLIMPKLPLKGLLKCRLRCCSSTHQLTIKPIQTSA